MKHSAPAHSHSVSGVKQGDLLLDSMSSFIHVRRLGAALLHEAID